MKDGNKIHQVIIGGESGVHYNFSQCKIEWIEDIIRQCRENNVPVFVKQLGCDIAQIQLCLKDWKGEDINEFPANLRIREFPEAIKHSQQLSLI